MLLLLKLLQKMKKSQSKKRRYIVGSNFNYCLLENRLEE